MNVRSPPPPSPQNVVPILPGCQADRFELVLHRVEEALAKHGGPYFLGESVSLVDVQFLPFVERMEASLAYYKGYCVRSRTRWPGLVRWLEAFEATPWYPRIKSDFYTHAHSLPPQLGGCVAAKGSEAVAAFVDGRSKGAWHLTPAPGPLGAGDGVLETLLPATTDQIAAARLEAAERLMRNHDSVARFAARAVGTPGEPSVLAAPLSDPYAHPAMNHLPAVDRALRVVVHVLLTGAEAVEIDADSVTPEGKVALGYLRDRVGVPRDMSIAAAMQLRAMLNFVIEEVGS